MEAVEAGGVPGRRRRFAAGGLCAAESSWTPATSIELTLYDRAGTCCAQTKVAPSHRQGASTYLCRQEGTGRRMRAAPTPPALSSVAAPPWRCRTVRDDAIAAQAKPQAS